MKPIAAVSVLIIYLTTASAQQPSQGPPSITKILEDAGQFSAFLRLLKITHMTGQISTQLQNSNDGLTLLVPTDSAFAGLESGTLNALSDKQQVELIQYHVIPQFLPKPLFQTVSNPLKTLADGTNDGKFPLNITIAGVDIKVSTGIDEATIGDSLYSDNQLAVYKIDHVLLPPGVFPPPSEPAPEKPKKTAPTAPTTTSASPNNMVVHGTALVTVGLAILASLSL